MSFVYILNTFLRRISKIHATKKGTMKNAMIINNKLNQAESIPINLNALIGPTIPIKPNPADSFVPAIPTMPDAIPETAAVINIGNMITG